MTRQPEDRDWERVVEAVDLDIRPEDLRAAERAMEEARELDHEPVSPAWVAATLARVAHDGAVVRDPEVPAQAIKPVLGGGWWQGVKRFAAALLALVGIQSAASAAVVGTAGIVAITATVFLWSGADGTRELNFTCAVTLLQRTDREDEQRGAITYLLPRVRDSITTLRFARDSGSSYSLKRAADRALTRIAAVAAQTEPIVASEAEIAAATDDFLRWIEAVRLASDGEQSLLRAVTSLSLAASVGLNALQQFGPTTASVQLARDTAVQKLTRELGVK